MAFSLNNPSDANPNHHFLVLCPPRYGIECSHVRHVIREPSDADAQSALRVNNDATVVAHHQDSLHGDRLPAVGISILSKLA